MSTFTDPQPDPVALAPKPAGPPRLRTSDAEREQVAAILRAAMTEGRLDLSEGELRLGQAYAATFRDEFGPLTADLPDGGRDALTRTPQARRVGRRALRRHRNFALSAALLLVGLWAVSPTQFFWPVIPLAFLAMSVARHARWHRHGSSYGPWRAGHPGGPPWART